MGETQELTVNMSQVHQPYRILEFWMLPDGAAHKDTNNTTTTCSGWAIYTTNQNHQFDAYQTEQGIYLKISGSSFATK